MASLGILRMFILTFLFVLLKASSLRADNVSRIDINLSHDHGTYDDVPLKVVTLMEDQELIVRCETRNDGVTTFYPRDPLNKTISYLNPLDFKGTINNEVLSYSAFRHNGLYLHIEEDPQGPTQLHIKLPRDTIIMAKNPETFGLNFACVYQPNDMSQPPSYKWLTVQFQNVYPMAFGCETGTNMLFKNSKPTIEDFSKNFRKFCLLDLEPGMIFGIYCQPGEHLEPSECLTKEDLDPLRGLVKPYQLTTMLDIEKEGGASSRIKLFEVSQRKQSGDVFLKCSCSDADNNNTNTLIVMHATEEYHDVRQYTRDFKEEANATISELFIRLEPGKKIYIRYMPDNELFLSAGRRVKAKLWPDQPEVYAYGESPVVIGNPSKIGDIIGSRGLEIRYVEDGEYMLHKILLSDDVLLVLKQELAIFHYIWRVRGIPGSVPVNGSLWIMFEIIPTDPYTYGCGVDSVDLFRPTGFKLQHEPGAVSTTKCKVNPYLSSPVGFYCPKGFTLEPPNCFTEMIHLKSGAKVLLEDIEPFARSIDGKHIKAADFHLPSIMEAERIYASDEFVCNCIDSSGRLRASITLDLSNPTSVQRKVHALNSIEGNVR
ncbi:hypothetical protein BaOVIS_023480 [Babesia ovis]|uniref:6-Cys domain-containing protein n=1 Tax=Babesia ovis TaxID=5869 RepID=A0A9W5WVJ8_BABOV|nr:hypothetical protein BaOVIS_023480 [Babesia ovis]